MRTVINGDNTFLEIRHATNEATGENSSSYSLISFNGENPDTVVIRMRVRIEENVYSYANDEPFTFRFRRTKSDGSGPENIVFARLSGQSILVSNVIEGDKIPDITQWTDLEFVLNARAQIGIYRIGGAEGTFTFDPNGELLGFMFTANSTATGLYIDDLTVRNAEPGRINKTYTASVVWDDAHDYAGIRPHSLMLTLGGKTVTVNEACQWQADFRLPAFDKNGAVISYTPTASAAGYTASLSEDDLSVVLSHTPELYATVKDGATKTAYFYNDFEGYYGEDGKVLENPVNHFYSGARISTAGQQMSLAGNGTNGYLCIDVTNTKTAYYQANFVNYNGGDFTVSFKLSTTGTLAPNDVYFQYRYGTSSSSAQKLFEISNFDGYSYKGSYLYDYSSSYTGSDQQIKSGQWVTVHVYFHMSDDGSSDTWDLYINNKRVSYGNKLPVREPDYKIPHVRLCIPGVDNNGRNLLVDDFIIYPGTGRPTLDKVKSPGYYFNETGVVVADKAADAQWSRDNATIDENVLKEAVNSADITWPDTRPKTHEAMNSALALYHMVLSVHMDEDVTADGVLVANEAAERIKLLVSGGREPWASVGCHWGHGVVASTMALAKNTPAIWNQLSADDISRVDLLMECLAIAANWGYNANNDYLTGFELSGDFRKGYGPNFLNTYMTCYLSAAMYFDADSDGNGEELDAIFNAFNYNSYITRLKAAGFTNILFTWTTVEESTNKSIGDYMTSGGKLTYNNVATSQGFKPGASAGDGVGVKIDFTYLSQIDGTTVYDSSQLTEIFIDTIKFTYGWAVTSSHNTPNDFGADFDKAYAYLLSDEINPRQGQMGMMTEYASDYRSRTTYCYLSAVNIAPLYANMKLFGYWNYDSNDDLLKMDNRIRVGTEDLFWKMDQGYYGVSSTASGPEYWSDFATAKGGIYVRDIFMNFHFTDDEPEDIAWDPAQSVSVLEEPAPVDPNYAGPAEDAIYAQGNYMDGYNVESNYVYLFDDKSASSNVKVSFDLVINDGLIPSSFKAYIMLDKAGSGRTSNDAPVVLYLHDGLIKASYKHGFWSTFMRFGENYRYHVEIEVDCTNKVYNISIQQIWPEVDGESAVTYQQNFATNANADITEIDSLIVMTSYLQRCIWLENLTAEKVEITIEQ